MEKTDHITQQSIERSETERLREKLEKIAGKKVEPFDNLPIEVASNIVKDWHQTEVIVLCKDRDDIHHIVTDGCDTEHKAEAGLSADRLKKMIGWPDNTLSRYTAIQRGRMLGVLEFMTALVPRMTDDEKDMFERILNENLPKGWRFRKTLDGVAIEYMGEVE